jgi:polysaccharide export outer membrane protein
MNQQSHTQFRWIPTRYLRTISVGFLLCSMLFQAGCFGSVTSNEHKEYVAPAGFLLGPEDELEITVWKNQDLSRITTIRPDGLISMPLIGDIQAAGLTSDALAQRITERLKQYFAITPAVAVSVKTINSYSVFVLGEVAKPGKYQLKSYITLLQAISMAGGFTDYAHKNKLQIMRVIENADHKREEVHIPLRYDDLVAGRGEQGNIVLHSGDTVVVP